MTATNPMIVEKEETYELIANPNDYYKEFDRITIAANLNPMPFDEFKTMLMEEILNTKNDIMVILNTVNSVKELYLHIRSNLEQKRKRSDVDKIGIWSSEQEQLYCLTTHIIPKHRLKKIETIRENEANKKRKIIIATQLVEAGVDISVKKIYRDFAPLDCLIQAAGRCNRNNLEQKGHVQIVKLVSEQGREYSSYIYDSTLLTTTHEILSSIEGLNNNKAMSEREFIFSAVNSYFETIKKRISNDPSREFIKEITGLNFRNLADFQLIKDRQTLSMFIEVDSDAKDTRKNYQKDLQESFGYDKKFTRLKYRQAINKYTISTFISKKDVGLFNLLETVTGTKFLRYISEEKLTDWYEKEIGLSPKKDSSFNMRFI